MRMVCLATLIVVGSVATGSARGVSPPSAPINVVFEWNRSIETHVPAAAPRAPSHYAPLLPMPGRSDAFSHLNLSREG